MRIKKYNQSSNKQIFIWILCDIILMNSALMLAQVLRYQSNFQYHYQFFHNSLYLAPVMTLIGLLSFHFFGIYRIMWRYTTSYDLLRIFLACFVTSTLTYLFSLITSFFSLPFILHRFVYLLFWILLTGFIALSRFIYYYTVSHKYLRSKYNNTNKYNRCMIIGASLTGATLVREMLQGQHGNLVPVVILEDNKKRTGFTLNGVPIIQGTQNILKLASDYKVSEIIIAISTPQDNLQPLLNKCLATGCRVKRITPLSNINEATPANNSLKDVDISDLLERPEEPFDMTSIKSEYCNKTVFISGGGGSIGSELCRIILTLSPKQIILFDMNENAMFNLKAELNLKYPKEITQTIELCIGSIRDENRLSQLFSQYKPDIILHAAAHKHVPLMEDCPYEALKNNVIGTYLMAKTAIKYEVPRFLLISTDKAVNPTNIMGATKRLAELIIMSLNGAGKTVFTAVRFGNVLGSHGSVVPLFLQQIRSGGPVTLTHPEIVRYFMTIPEAAKLVLQAGVLADSGELYVLDMGQPVKIRQLAERMIQLYAPQTTKRIDIEYCGLRPGEKLYEELLLDEETSTKTSNKKIFVTHPEILSISELNNMICEVQQIIKEHEPILPLLKKYVPTFSNSTQEINKSLNNNEA